MRFLLLLPLLVLCACGNRTAGDPWLDGKVRERKPDSFVPEVFVTAKPARPYKEIALVRFPTETTDAKQMRHLKDACRARGGDGIMLVGYNSQTSTNFVGDASSRRFTEAVVIEYIDASAASDKPAQ